MLGTPLVTVAEFRAAPTLLDTLNLRSGQPLSAQDAELENVLLRASAWCGNFLSSGMQVSAHTVLDKNCRGRVTPDGQLWLNPMDYPVLSVEAVAYGDSPSQMTPVSNLDAWIEDGALVSVAVPAGTSSRPYVRWSYTAGYVATRLAADVLAGASSIVVTDPTGLQPGDELRLWDPAAEETVRVANSYAAGSTTVPLVASLLHAHDAGTGPGDRVGVSALPEDFHLAVILVGTVLLMRPDSTAEDSFPDTPLTTSTREVDPRHEGSGLLLEAKRILRSYRKVR